MKVYYNESCNICRAEINLYKRQNIKEIDWIDITNNVAAEKDTLRDDKSLLRRLHVEENGKIFDGAKAFLLVWKKIPKYRFLYKFFKLPIIFNIFSLGYEVIAYLLYLKNKKQLKKLIK
jgi:predicted DCC family thiol-disulfide oxidoreductase YuxK